MVASRRHLAEGLTRTERLIVMSNKRMGSGEDRLIARYFKPLATHPGAFGLVDDAAAIMPPKGCDIVLKTDGIIGGVHFFHDDPPETVARKALRVNLSDLAAKGARPVGFLLTLALPSGMGDAWLRRFARGLGADAERFGCPLFGGDTDRTPGPITISIAAFGAVPHGKMVLRTAAKVGERVLVTGTIGDAALGLLLRKEPDKAARWGLTPRHARHLTRRYLEPQPRNAIAKALLTNASAAMDVSDGLVGDLSKLCRASGVTADIDVARVPLSPAARKVIASDPDLIGTVLTGGDDYEVLLTMTPRRVAAFHKAASAAGVEVTEIGNVVQGDGKPRFLDPAGKPLAFAQPSFSHF
jgi:thiamine-monophosphate kinase